MKKKSRNWKNYILKPIKQKSGDYYEVDNAIFVTFSNSATENIAFLFILLAANSHPNTDDEEEEDNDYSPEDDDYKKVISTASPIGTVVGYMIQMLRFFEYFFRRR